MRRSILSSLVFLFSISSAFSQNYRVKTLAGDSAGYKNGPDSVALFNTPTGIAVDTTGNVYVADTYNNVIRKISVTDSVTTYAGKDSSGYRNGVASNALFSGPQGICVDKNGNIYIADTYNNVIRKISGGMVTTLAGDGRIGFRDGQADSAEFYLPVGIAVDTSGNVYVTDNGNFAVREISKSGTVSTIAGIGYAGFVNGSIDSARFDGLYGIAVTPAGSDVYVTEYINNDVRLIQNGMVSVFAGTDSTITNRGYQNGNPVNEALFNEPTGICLNASGSIFISDEYNNLIREISNNYVTTLAGNDTAGVRDTLDYLAEFNEPIGIAVHKGIFYVADNANNRIRKITPTNPLGGISNIDQKDILVSVYPNPCSDKLVVTDAPTGSAEMIDVTGRQVWSVEHSKAPFTIATSNLSAGVYFLRINSTEGTATKKVVVER
jgi:hypothetical protein